MKETVLLYTNDAKKKAEIVKILRITGVTVKMIETAMLGESVAYLADVLGATASVHPYEGGEKPDCMVMCSLTRKKMDALLLSMKKHKIFMPNKAMLTQTNMNWSFGKLIDEVEQEHKLVTAWNKLDKLIKQIGAPAGWAKEILDKKDVTIEEINDAVKQLEKTV